MCVLKDGFGGWQQSWHDTITKHDFQIPASGADIMVAMVSRSSSEFYGTRYYMLNKHRCLTSISAVKMTSSLPKPNGTSTLNVEEMSS